VEYESGLQLIVQCTTTAVGLVTKDGSDTEANVDGNYESLRQAKCNRLPDNHLVAYRARRSPMNIFSIFFSQFLRYDAECPKIAILGLCMSQMPEFGRF
jgi:hypothetical protein